MPSNTSAGQASKKAKKKTCEKQSSTCKTNSHMQNAVEFREAYKVPNTLEQLNLQLTLIGEEVSEFVQANRDMNMMLPITRADTLKELADVAYVLYQYAACMDWDLDEALQRVHTSNMSKLLNGMPIRREDGKVLKGPNYQPPDLIDLV